MPDPSVAVVKIVPSPFCETPGTYFPLIMPNGYVYETFGISKHFPVKLQVILIRAEKFDNPLTAKCFIYDVVCMLFILLDNKISFL